jgi:hypothetical protein
MTVAVADVKSKLLTVDQFMSELKPTEGLSSVDLPEQDEGTVEFSLPEGWNAGLKEASSTSLTQATVRIGPQEFVLSKDAVLTMTTALGITRDYVCKVPGELLAPHLNYWWAKGGLNFRILINASSEGIAAVKKTIVPFSNTWLLENMLAAVHEAYGKDTEVLIDYKRQHDLRATHFRMVIPGILDKIIPSFRNTSEEDRWSVGVELRNSIIGEKPLSLRGYLFAWICTNGATSVHASSGNYNRRTMGQGTEVYDWAKGQVDAILSGLEHELEAVTDLTSVELDGSVSQVMQSMFERYRVPLASREQVIENLVDSDDLTAYGLMAAVTEAANTDDLPFGQVASLLEIGGDLPHSMSDRCKSCNRL